jgi:GAF domain-containing protein
VVSDAGFSSPRVYRYALGVAESATITQATEEFDSRVDHLLQTTCEVARALVGAHQTAMAMMIGGDWTQARKYFSLSDKYEQWKDFTMPARGVGLHGIVVSENEAIRLAEDELEQHPAWRGFADAAEHHQPLRGLLGVPIVGEDGLNYGLLQASDKVDGSDFDEDDERRLQRLADAAAVGLDALRKVRALRVGESVPAAPLEAEATFVVIEPA